MKEIEKYDLEIIKKKAIVIDDREEFRKMFSRFFEYEGFVVSTADGFQSGIDLLQKEFFHVAAVDLSLSGNSNKDGLKIIKTIRETLKEGTEAILLSAYGTLEEGALATEYGAFKVVQKENVNPSDFAIMVNKAYEKASDALSKPQLGLNFLAGYPVPNFPQSVLAWTSKALTLLPENKFQDLDSFITKVLKDFYPLLYSAKSSQAEIQTEKRLICGTYWSKMIGKAIMIDIGPTDLIHSEIEEFENNKNNIKKNRESILRATSKNKLASVVFSLNESARAEFKQNFKIGV